MSKLGERVKGVEYSFQHFLWKNMDDIRDTWNSGNYARALELLITLVVYLPRWAKDKFRDRFNKVGAEFRTIRGKGPSWFVQGIDQNKERQMYARAVFPGLMDELTSALDERGIYLERKSMRLERTDFDKLEKDTDEDQVDKGKPQP